MTAPTGAPETDLRCHICGGVLGGYMLIEGETVCINCAADMYDLTQETRLMPAWLLVHGRDLDKCGKSR